MTTHVELTSSSQLPLSDAEMPPPPHPPIAPAAAPSRQIFDPYNSSRIGHQRFENRLSSSTIYALSRQAKLSNQLQGKAGGEDLLILEGGTGDGGTERWAGIHEALKYGTISLAEGVKPRAEGGLVTILKKDHNPPNRKRKAKVAFADDARSPELEPLAVPPPPTPPHPEAKPLFANLSFYINGSTQPPISDGQLKRLISDNGGRVLISYMTKGCTHIILGNLKEPRSGSTIQQREVLAKRATKVVRIVGVEWVMDCIEQGKVLDWRGYRSGELAEKESFEALNDEGISLEETIEKAQQCLQAPAPVKAPDRQDASEKQTANWSRTSKASPAMSNKAKLAAKWARLADAGLIVSQPGSVKDSGT